jgi:hypothetical protein
MGLFHLVMHALLDQVGGRLGLRHQTLLPPRCAICNRSVDSPPRRLAIPASGTFATVGEITIYAYFCRRHASRRLQLAVLFGVLALLCVLLAYLFHDAPKRSTRQTITLIAFLGAIFSSVLAINSLLHHSYFRGIDFHNDLLQIKGFGKHFRESLREEDLRIINEA